MWGARKFGTPFFLGGIMRTKKIVLLVLIFAALAQGALCFAKGKSKPAAKDTPPRWVVSESYPIPERDDIIYIRGWCYTKGASKTAAEEEAFCCALADVASYYFGEISNIKSEHEYSSDLGEITSTAMNSSFLGISVITSFSEDGETLSYNQAADFDGLWFYMAASDDNEIEVEFDYDTALEAAENLKKNGVIIKKEDEYNSKSGYVALYSFDLSKVLK